MPTILIARIKRRNALKNTSEDVNLSDISKLLQRSVHATNNGFEIEVEESDLDVCVQKLESNGYWVITANQLCDIEIPAIANASLTDVVQYVRNMFPDLSVNTVKISSNKNNLIMQVVVGIVSERFKKHLIIMIQEIFKETGFFVGGFGINSSNNLVEIIKKQEIVKIIIVNSNYKNIIAVSSLARDICKEFKNQVEIDNYTVNDTTVEIAVDIKALQSDKFSESFAVFFAEKFKGSGAGYSLRNSKKPSYQSKINNVAADLVYLVRITSLNCLVEEDGLIPYVKKVLAKDGLSSQVLDFYMDESSENAFFFQLASNADHIKIMGCLHNGFLAWNSSVVAEIQAAIPFVELEFMGEIDKKTDLTATLEKSLKYLKSFFNIDEIYMKYLNPKVYIVPFNSRFSLLKSLQLLNDISTTSDMKFLIRPMQMETLPLPDKLKMKVPVRGEVMYISRYDKDFSPIPNISMRHLFDDFKVFVGDYYYKVMISDGSFDYYKKLVDESDYRIMNFPASLIQVIVKASKIDSKLKEIFETFPKRVRCFINSIEYDDKQNILVFYAMPKVGEKVEEASIKNFFENELGCDNVSVELIKQDRQLFGEILKESIPDEDEDSVFYERCDVEIRIHDFPCDRYENQEKFSKDLFNSSDFCFLDININKISYVNSSLVINLSYEGDDEDFSDALEKCLCKIFGKKPNYIITKKTTEQATFPKNDLSFDLNNNNSVSMSKLGLFGAKVTTDLATRQVLNKRKADEVETKCLDDEDIRNNHSESVSLRDEELNVKSSKCSTDENSTISNFL